MKETYQNSMLIASIIYGQSAKYYLVVCFGFTCNNYDVIILGTYIERERTSQLLKARRSTASHGQIPLAPCWCVACS